MAIRKKPRAERESERCTCYLCVPPKRGSGVKVNKRYGYDENKVPGVECCTCGKKIGRSKWVEETGMARFGQMQFRHKRCAETLKR